MDLTVVTWKWRCGTYPTQFTAEHVNTMHAMVARHLHVPHRFVCITDDDEGIDARVEVIPLWNDFAHLRNPASGKNKPSCYRRLRAFAADAGDWLGERILSIDLDAVIVDDMTPIVERDEDFVIWGDTAKGTPYNGGLWLLKAGSRRQVWDNFDPSGVPAKGRALGYVGSDQAAIAVLLGPDEPIWTRADGVWSFRNDFTGRRSLPDGARIVMFHGSRNPWDAEVMREQPWVREHWR